MARTTLTFKSNATRHLSPTLPRLNATNSLASSSQLPSTGKLNGPRIQACFPARIYDTAGIVVFHRPHLARRNWHQVRHLPSPMVLNNLCRPACIAHVSFHCPRPVSEEVRTSLPPHLASLMKCGVSIQCDSHQEGMAGNWDVTIVTAIIHLFTLCLSINTSC
jgi:hypothetical protein